MFATTDRRAIAIAAALVFALVFGADLLLVPTGPGTGDEAEAQTVPYILGIAHPTGFPAYVLAGWLWSHVLAVNTIAWRLNAFMAFLTAVSAGGVVLLATEIGAAVLASSFAGLVFAFGNWVWLGALHANAQPLAGALSVFALLACAAFARFGERRAFVIACALCGFALATHPAAVFVIPAIAVSLAWQWRTLSFSLLLPGAAALVAPLALYGALPLRALTIGAGDPTSGPPLFHMGSIDWNMQAGSTVAGFLDEVLGRNEGASGSLRAVGHVDIVPSAIAAWFTLLMRQFNLVTIVLAALGAIVLATINLRALTILVAGTLGGVIFSYIYRTDAHLDRYVFVSYAIVAVLAAAVSRMRIPRLAAPIVATATALILAVLTVRAVAINRGPVTPHVPSDGARIIAAVALDTPGTAIVVAQWNDAGALGYGAYAARTLGSRLIVGAWPGDFLYEYGIWSVQRPLYVLESPIALRELPERFGDVTITERPSRLPGYHLYEVESPRKNLRR